MASCNFEVQSGRVEPKLKISPGTTETPVLIAGAGVAGTATALALEHNLDIKPIIFDERTKWQLTAGTAGINLQAEAIRALNKLGISTTSLIQAGNAIKKQSYYCPDGRLVSTLDKEIGNHTAKNGPIIPGQIAIHEGILAQMLLDTAASKGIKVMTSHRVAKVTSNTATQISVGVEEIQSCKENEMCDNQWIRKHKYDGAMLIGADGIDSSVRKQNLQHCPKQCLKRDHGMTQYCGVARRCSTFLDGSTMILVGGLNVKLVVYPISSPDARGMQDVNWLVEIKDDKVMMDSASTATATATGILELLVDNGFDLDFLDIATLVNATESIISRRMADLEPLDSWTKQCIGLVGDAAHAMLPVGSSGTTAALLDALAIGEAFEKSGPVPVPDILRLYQSMRYEDVSNKHHRNRLMPAEQVMQEVLDNVPSAQQVPTVYAERIRAAMKPLHQGGPMMEREKLMSSPTEKRVLIVGAGASGLTACKEFLDVGYSPIILEGGKTFGGVFRDAYKNLELTSSSCFTSYSDFPPSNGHQGPPKMWTGPEYLSYLHRYAVQNDVFKHIRFNSTVVGITRVEGSGEDMDYEIAVRDSVTGEIRFVTGRVLVLCVGSNAKPSVPTFDGQDGFDGEVVHTSEIDGFELFRNKRVLSLGIGESGSDLPWWIAKEPGTAVTVAARGLGWCAPRRRPLTSGLPTDLNTNRILWGLPRIFSDIFSFTLVSFYTDDARYFSVACQSYCILMISSSINIVFRPSSTHVSTKIQSFVAWDVST